jgi:geranylgeranyl diphosphate synthase type II
MAFDTPRGAVVEADYAFYKTIRRKVDARLETFYPETAKDSRLICALRHALLSPGKRFRPIITLLSYAECGGDIDDALDAACAVEMVHAASLVMDDLPSMDNARLRRGRLATHIVFGEGTGMLAAVTLLNEAYRIIASGSAGGPAEKLRATHCLAQAVGPEGLAGGQERDIMCAGAADGSHSLNDIEKRHFEKTGALFAAAASIGAELAGAGPSRVMNMRQFGSALGLAYQAFDDVIDVEATESGAGKDIDQDSGKATVVSLLGQDGARHSAQRWLQRAIATAHDANGEEPSMLASLAGLVGAKFGISETIPPRTSLKGRDSAD